MVGPPLNGVGERRSNEWLFAGRVWRIQIGF